MNRSEIIAQHFHNVYFGGNWSDSNLRDQTANLSWQEATRQIEDLNSIASLVFHLNYYSSGISDVLRGGPLVIRDKFSFALPPIENQADWDSLREKALEMGETFPQLIAQVPEDQLSAPFTDEKYGSYHSNFIGLLEHFHYHLGQIALLRKLVRRT